MPPATVRWLSVLWLSLAGAFITSTAAQAWSTGMPSAKLAVVPRPSQPAAATQPRRPRPAESELEPLALLEADDAMKSWLRRNVLAGTPPARRLERLAAALRSPTFGLVRSRFPEVTPTAREAFASRRTNCVGYALLFTSLARELGIPAFFVFVDESRSGEAWGDVEVAQDHLVVGVRRGSRLQLFDLDGKLPRPPRSAEPVPDLRVFSIFFSNRGVEALAHGDLARAAVQLRRAVELDPAHPAAWVNLSVVHNRYENPRAAEFALRRALQLAPDARGAINNLAALLARTGREDEALELARRHAGATPIDTLQWAASQLRSGDLEAARRLYRRALRMSQWQ